MSPVPYTGDETLRDAVFGALATVVDPEMALGILDVGLVYGVTVEPSGMRVLMTMTSAACPVAEVVVEEVEDALRRVVSDQRPIGVELCWDPPWTPDRMSERARKAMGW